MGVKKNLGPVGQIYGNLTHGQVYNVIGRFLRGPLVLKSGRLRLHSMQTLLKCDLLPTSYGDAT